MYCTQVHYQAFLELFLLIGEDHLLVAVVANTVPYAKLGPDPPTDPYGSEEESSQPVILVYRRDQYGIKYRSYEPYKTVQQSSGSGKPTHYAWVTDPATGREYKRAVSASPPPVPRQYSRSADQHNTGHDRHYSSVTPQAGGRRGVRTPSHTRPSATDRIPVIVALENRDGKHSDSKIPTVVDWARNCPVAYTEKIKYDELNLPMWVWAFVP